MIVFEWLNAALKTLKIYLECMDSLPLLLTTQKINLKVDISYIIAWRAKILVDYYVNKYFYIN